MRFLSLLFLLLISTLVIAQNHSISVELDQAANKEIQLTYHFLGKIYPNATIKLDEKGKGTFAGDTLLPQGLYKIYLDKDHHFDFLLGADQEFTLTNPGFDSNTMKIKGTIEGEEFVSYLGFLEEMKARGAKLNSSFKNASDSEKEKIRQDLKELNQEMQSYWEQIGKKYPGSFLYQFLVANYVPPLDIETLPAEVQQNDSLLLLARFNYQKDHFWDYFDYTDERMLYTPFYKSKLETWFTKVLYQNYDSIKPYAYEFLDRVEKDKRIFQFATSYFLNSSINSNVLGLDALFVDLAQDYYLSGKAFWAGDESIEKIKENVFFLKDNLIGNIAPDLTMENFDGEYVNLHQIEAEITLVLIFEPHCSHCKVFVPELYKDVFLPNKERGLEVFAIYSMDNKEEWTDFLSDHDMFEWHNVWDPNHTTRFKVKYDGRKTPGIYVLDKDKKIIAKKLVIEQIKSFVEEGLN